MVAEAGVALIYRNLAKHPACTVLFSASPRLHEQINTAADTGCDRVSPASLGSE